MKKKRDKSFWIGTTVWFMVIIAMFVTIINNFNQRFETVFNSIILLLAAINIVLALYNLNILRRMYD